MVMKLNKSRMSFLTQFLASVVSRLRGTRSMISLEWLTRLRDTIKLNRNIILIVSTVKTSKQKRTIVCQAPVATRPTLPIGNPCDVRLGHLRSVPA